LNKLKTNKALENVLSNFVASANLIVSPTLNLAAFFVQIFMVKFLDFQVEAQVMPNSA
jgi:hypothetical protein